MSSKITLKNNIDTEFTIEHSDGKVAKTIKGQDIAVAVDTIDDFPTTANDGDIVIVRDLNRGGTFIYDSSEVANDNRGTNFNGWIRQYSGAVNLKWFDTLYEALTFASTNVLKSFAPSDIVADESISNLAYINIDLMGNEVSFSFSGNFLVDIDELHISNGSMSEIVGDYAHIYYTEESKKLYINNVSFDGQSLQNNCILTANLICPIEVYITYSFFRNFNRNAISITGGQSSQESRFYVKNNYFKNIGIDEAQPHRAIQIGSNYEKVYNVTVSDNVISDVYSGNGECNAILVYGVNVNIEGNKISAVSNTLADDCEGIYVKSAYAKIIGNTLENAGNSHDGCINIKGSSWDTDSQFSGYSIISNNNVIISDVNIDVPAIAVNKSNVIVSNNILTDLRTVASSKPKSIAIGIGTSFPVSDVIIESNIINGFNNLFGTDTTYRANFSDDVIIRDNIATKCAGGYVMSYRTDAIIQKSFAIVASTKTITVADSSVEFDKNIYKAGDTITIAGTTSNNGNFTIASVSQYSIIVNEVVINETTSSSASIVKTNSKGFTFSGNHISFLSQGDYALRNRGGNCAIAKITDNIFDNFNYIYRLDLGTITQLDVRNNISLNVGTGVRYGSFAATKYYYEADSNGVTGGSGSGGAGNQYVQMTVNGTTYKLLHDGTV